MGGKSSKPLSFYHTLDNKTSEMLFNVFRKKKREKFADNKNDMDIGEDINNNATRLIIVLFIIILFFSILFKIRKK